MSLWSIVYLNMDWTCWVLPNKQNVANLKQHFFQEYVTKSRFGSFVIFVCSLSMAIVETSFCFVSGTHIKELMFPGKFQETMPSFSVPSWHHCCVLSQYITCIKCQRTLLCCTWFLNYRNHDKKKCIVFKLLSLETICYPKIGKACITLKH